MILDILLGYLDEYPQKGDQDSRDTKIAKTSLSHGYPQVNVARVGRVENPTAQNRASREALILPEFHKSLFKYNLNPNQCHVCL